MSHEKKMETPQSDSFFENYGNAGEPGQSSSSRHEDLDVERAGASQTASSESIDFEDDSPDEVIALMEQQLEELRDRELKAQAELENFRKRLQRDTEQTLKFASVPLIRDLLDVLDNLSRATDAASHNAEAKPIVEGVKLVQTQMMSVLEKYHCRPIQAIGQVFDPNLHQAISQAPSEEIPAGHVCLEASVGYIMHDRVVRPSQVIVSTGKPS